MFFAAIDIGASFIKSAVLDLETGQLLHIERCRFPRQIISGSQGYREWKTDEVVSQARLQIDRLLIKQPNCAGIVGCGQMHCVVLACAADGSPQSNLITWQDERSTSAGSYNEDSPFDKLKSRLTAKEIQELGNELMPGLPITTLTCLADEGRILTNMTPCSLIDFVLARLCGARPSQTDATNAAAHGLYNVEKSSWHDAVIEKLGLSRMTWPKIAPPGTVIGNYVFREAELPVYCPFGDHQCAVYSAAPMDGDISVNISTGSQVSTVTPLSEPGAYQIRPYFGGLFLRTVTRIPAGRSLNSIVRLFTDIPGNNAMTTTEAWDWVSRIMEDDAECPLEMNLAFFPSSFGDSGAICGIKENNLTASNLFCAAFRNMASNYFVAANRILPQADWRRLLLTGGLAHTLPTLRSIVTKRFGLPATLSGTPNDTLDGLLRISKHFRGARTK
jgi:sugar (pentulose or hexulose) kinase